MIHNINDIQYKIYIYICLFRFKQYNECNGFVEGQSIRYSAVAKQSNGNQTNKEKIRQIIETDFLNQLSQAKKISKNDLMLLQETLRFIIRIIALNFEINNLEANFGSTTRIILELYQYFGLSSKAELLQSEKPSQSKQSVFLNLVQHLVDITRMALELTIKSQTNLRLFCLGKEIGEKGVPNNSKVPLLRRVQRSESNHQDKVYQSKKSIQRLDSQHIYESLPKSQRTIEETRYYSRDTSAVRNPQQRKTEIPQNNKALPCINQMKSIQLSLYRQLKQRNSSIHNSIQTYIRQIYDKNTITD
ncbi:unnamed protein product [Paramecium octaurelia]|uniref:Uncharacterized protein n=1 Tax=Paramecium octaurelia TaxID=43137 RepID=A0A8S1W5L7_PAROT|nr:unnamed protein product [Paramecium octaurelia]